MMRHLYPFIFFIGFFTLSCAKEGKQKEDVETHQTSDKAPHFAHVNYQIPDSMLFCGEWISFQDIDLRERLDRELLVNTNFHSATMLYIKRANRYFPEMEQTLSENGLPNDLKYLAVAESGLAQATSATGAKGLWQFMPATAKDFQLTVNDWVDERMHISKSTAAACKYLQNAYDTFGKWSLAVASYNRGMGGVHADMSWQDSDDYFDTHMNTETGRYLFRILAIKLIMENPAAFGFDVNGMELYEPYQTQSMKVTNGLANVSDWANKKGFNYKIVKLLNPWILKNQLPANDTFEILLPIAKTNLKPISAYK